MPQHYITKATDTIALQEDGQPFPVTVSPATGATVKRGTPATLAVSLPVKPSATHTVTSQIVWQSDSALTISGGSSLTFTTANFATPQNVTLSYNTPVSDAGHALVKVSASGPDNPGFQPVYVYVDLVG